MIMRYISGQPVHALWHAGGNFFFKDQLLLVQDNLQSSCYLRTGFLFEELWYPTDGPRIKQHKTITSKIHQLGELPELD